MARGLMLAPCACMMNPTNSGCPDRSIARRKQRNNAKNGMEIDESNSKVEKTCFSGCISSSHIMDALIGNSEKDTINGGYNDYSTKKRRDRSLCLNSMSSNTIEAAIIDLEELMNRIKWLKSVLNLRFSQHHAPYK
ncbi:hypothetical protein AAZX31_08G233300 [Glycine max]